jgi:hypothetical protein
MKTLRFMYRCKNDTVLHLDVPLSHQEQKCEVKWTRKSNMSMADFPSKEAGLWLEEVRAELIRYGGQLEVNKRLPVQQGELFK